MNCRQAKSDIALWVGGDLPDREQHLELRRHVLSCPDCRAHYRRLKGTMEVLEGTDRQPTYRAGDSLWPGVASRMRQQTASPGSRFNGWLPLAAMTAASALLVVALDNTSPPERTAPDAPVARDMWHLPSWLRSEPTIPAVSRELNRSELLRRNAAEVEAESADRTLKVREAAMQTDSF